MGSHKHPKNLQMSSPNHKSQAVSPSSCLKNQLPKSQIASSVPVQVLDTSVPQINSRKHCPPSTELLKTQIASSVPPKFFLQNEFPKSQHVCMCMYAYMCVCMYVYVCVCLFVCMSVESSPTISNLKGRLPNIFSENQVPKARIARGVPIGLFRESSPQISNGKGCSPMSLHRIKSPNPKSQGVSP